MAIVTARIKVKGKHYEISVDLDEALKIRAGKGDIASALQTDKIFYDLKKGTSCSTADLVDAFGTTDVYAIATQIMTKGEVQKTQEFRDSERDAKVKRIVNMILRNASDQNGRPYTEDRLNRAISEIHYNFDNKPDEQQMNDLIEKLKTVIPIKVELKKIKITIPAQYTGQAYNIVKAYKDSEDWLANGSLQVTISIPAGLQIEFYDKLNSITHGAAQTEELKG
jgi:ribosome maturation protein SDO1